MLGEVTVQRSCQWVKGTKPEVMCVRSYHRLDLGSGFGEREDGTWKDKGGSDNSGSW